jgi:threonine dehydrogenase-like Zn-dependent dehydrogenase
VVDPVEVIRELTDGWGADASVDAAGVQRALDAALDSTAVDGLVVQVAVPMEPLHIEVARFRRNSTHLTASNDATPDAFRQVIDLMTDGHYPVDGWTETVPFADIVPAGFEPLNRQEKMKVLVDPAV